MSSPAIPTQQRITAGRWLALLATAIIIFLSLDLGGVQPEFRVKIAPASAKEGSVHVVFYGRDFDAYRSAGSLTVPATGWQIIRGADSTVLVGQPPAEALEIKARDVPVKLALVHHAGGGTLSMDNGAGYTHSIALQSPNETVSSLVIGGPDSAAPPSGEVARFSLPVQIAAAAAVLALLIAITWQMSRRPQAGAIRLPSPKRIEIAFFALPFLLTTCATLIAFVPGNVSYDGSLQWVQAAGRGELFEPLGYPATYLMRMFTRATTSPLPLLILQSVLAAFGMALVLRELRYRGVPFLITLAMATAIAITPQYFSFFTNLGKDPLSLMGTLFFAWALLHLFRQPKNSRPSWKILSALIAAGLFSGLMRNNVMPIILLVLACALVLLFWRRRNYALIGAGAVFLIAAMVIPKVLVNQATQEVDKYQRPAERVRILPNADLPLGVFTNLYIYHLFSAAMANGVAVPEEEAKPFFAIMPQDQWKKYSCYMTDTTMASLGRNIRFTQQEYNAHLQQHQTAMAKTVVGIVQDHPGLLFDRQACITKVLWQIGVGQHPFQATTMLGYDIVDKRFLPLAGESRTLWPSLRHQIQRYEQWTENSSRFWLFWKPALPLMLGFFIVALYLARNRDVGVILVALLPVISIAQLLLVIPFPAYRYAYPSVLIMLLLSTLVFSRPGLAAQTAKASD
ncbi:hypothetical protein RAS12_16245 [Achromobacter seleniivolatilans]|uniref:Glycosyltransferase RgtA/B/C/D-like domain-containing protein n=1 Tax=Achromobacter seleniivolatilans TaxID=3047478 RepID=A0ABY9LTZ0_9BURK|nr:hypothetical protein [Achromobacter sp. R39]WMD18202.1 hypothetical protein RAS12_16245 [Achromobacter sp. R39]